MDTKPRYSVRSANSRGLKTKVKAVDGVIESLRQDIVTGRLARGSKMPSEKFLADGYRVSQPTLREALRALEAMGLIEARHGSGCYVTGHADFAMASGLQTWLQLGQIGTLDVLEVRRLFGIESAKFAASHADEANTAEIRNAYEAFNQAGAMKNEDDVVRLIVGFQAAIASVSPNLLLSSLEIVLVRILIETQVKASHQRGMDYWIERALSFQPDRAAILTAIEARSPERAEEAMQRYFDNQRHTFATDRDLSHPQLVDIVSAMVGQLREASF